MVYDIWRRGRTAQHPVPWAAEHSRENLVKYPMQNDHTKLTERVESHSAVQIYRLQGSSRKGRIESLVLDSDSGANFRVTQRSGLTSSWI